MEWEIERDTERGREGTVEGMKMRVALVGGQEGRKGHTGQAGEVGRY
jgi:hypothetical protein